jgi:hypothetical protein
MLRVVWRGAARGLSLLDLVVVLAVLALLIYLTRLDWRPRRPAEAPAPPTSTVVPPG